jgi:mannitol-1-phosphate/altronate dehydrogenase
LHGLCSEHHPLKTWIEDEEEEEREANTSVSVAASSSDDDSAAAENEEEEECQIVSPTTSLPNVDRIEEGDE